MQSDRVIHLALLMPILFETVHGHYAFVLVLCRVLGSLQNVEIIYSINYDKTELLRFNSTENKVVAYTEYAMKWADDFNKKPEWLHMEAEKGIADCKRFGQLYLPEVEKTVKPEVIIRSVRQASGKSPAMLICSAYDFYPKPIKLTWMRDDKEVTADVTSTEEMANGDWYYQIHSHLEYFPKPGEKISCVVEHASSHRPMIYHWDPPLSESERYKIITGAEKHTVPFKERLLTWWIYFNASQQSFQAFKTKSYLSGWKNPEISKTLDQPMHMCSAKHKF